MFNFEEECKRMRETSGNIKSESSLVKFLYLLARDGLPLGKIETLLDQVAMRQPAEFTNGWLAQWAMDAAERLK